MLAVIIINVLLVAFVLAAIVGSHLWAIASSREPQAEPAAVRAARPRARQTQPRTAGIPRSAAATR